jgi:hypothetical protein
MTNLPDNLLLECQQIFTDHGALDPVLQFLRDRGYYKIDSIKVVMRLLGKPLRETNALVHLSPVWADTREGDDLLQDQFLRTLKPDV